MTSYDIMTAFPVSTVSTASLTSQLGKLANKPDVLRAANMVLREKGKLSLLRVREQL
jgi:hypothetical protein